MSASSQAETVASSEETPAGGRLRSLARLVDISPRLLQALFLLGLIGGLTAVYSIVALRVGNFQPDEWYYLEIAHFIAHDFPAGLWVPHLYSRGIERIDQLILAAPFALTRGASVYEVAHVIQALLFVSTAIPTWLLARAAGLGRLTRALAATLAVLVPWAIVSTSFLEGSAAYLAYAWALYATWTVTLKPSVRSEAVALIALAVAAFTRTQLIALAPILPLAVLWQEWRWGLAGRPWRRRARELPGRLWSRYRLLSIITIVAAVAVVLSLAELLPGGGVGALTGYYGLPAIESVGNVLSRYDYYLSRIVVGTGVIAFALGLAWVIRTLARPSDGRRHALAVVVVLGIVMMLVSLVQGGADERYILYAAMPVALAFAAELGDVVRRGRPASIARAASVLAGTAAVMALIASATWTPPQGGYDFFTYPANVFYERVLLGRLSLLNIPVIHPDASQLVQIGIAIVLIAWIVAVLSGRAVRPVAVIIAAAVLVLCGAEAGYAMDKFAVASGAVAVGPTAAQRSWVESQVPPGANVTAVGIGMGGTPGYISIWRTAEFWNTAIRRGAAFVPFEVPTIPFGDPGMVFSIHSPSGVLSATETLPGSPRVPVPRYLLVPTQGTNPIGFAGRLVGDDPAVPVSLVKASNPPAVEWAIGETSAEGFMFPGKPAVATVYGVALRKPDRCARFALIGPPGYAGRWPYTVRSGTRRVASGRLASGQTQNVKAVLHPRTLAHGQLATLTISVHGQVPFVTGQTVSAQLAFFSVGGCAEES